MRKEFKVVTKAAIFNRNKSRVLVIHMERNNDFGLPGGHIEENEDIDDAMQRELQEECGINSKRFAESRLLFPFEWKTRTCLCRDI